MIRARRKNLSSKAGSPKLVRRALGINVLSVRGIHSDIPTVLTPMRRCSWYLLSLIGAMMLFACASDPSPASSSEASAAIQTKPNSAPSGETPAAQVSAVEAAAVPDGMVFVPGGTTRIGSNTGQPNEQPTFVADVEPFYLDRHPVTVASFREFVDATGYTTQAETFGNAGVLDTEQRRWRLVEGAVWHHPMGPENPAAAPDHPVTQVSWNDAEAYCSWAGGRLPTEMEWEHAARDARNDRDRYSWGTSLAERGTYYANTWQGSFPVRNTGADGFRHTSPVGAFGETPLGLTDMGGNVWEWTASWYRPYPHETTSREGAQERTQRGGSFLCHDSYCHGYRVSARSHSTPETSLFHVGFRCAQDAATQPTD